MPCPSAVPVDPRVRRTRKLLQDALRALLHEKTYASISVSDIAARATVNRNTFYAHYDDKQDLLASVLRADLAEALQRQFPALPPFTRANLAVVATTVFRYLGELEAACPRTARDLEPFISAALQEEIYELIHAWLTAAGPRRAASDHTREAAATLVSWGLFGSAYRWSRGKRERKPEEMADELAAMLFPAVDPRGPAVGAAV